MTGVARVLLLLLLFAGTAFAEIYRWTDAAGNLHFSEDLSQVPPQYRDQAQKREPSESSVTIQTYSAPASTGRSTSSRSRGVIRIPFQRQGTLMWVNAVVNDIETVPFLVDTGASGVSIPASVVSRLGIRIRPDTPSVTVATANGLVGMPVVEIASVQVGAARVENLRATVNPTMSIGLLGGSFFNNFTYAVDAAAGVITLVPNEGVRAGAAAAQWRERFDTLRNSIERLETYLSNREISRANRRHELEQNLADLKQELVDLENEADLAGVPKAWRQ